MVAQPLHRAAVERTATRLPQPSEVWGKSCAKSRPVAGNETTNPTLGLETSVFLGMLKTAYQELSVSFRQRVRPR